MIFDFAAHVFGIDHRSGVKLIFYFAAHVAGIDHRLRVKLGFFISLSLATYGPISGVTEHIMVLARNSQQSS